jgi:ectoine hydroxylase-related dioxygenase (phytanoyl-CoA dioxygenase family)
MIKDIKLNKQLKDNGFVVLNQLLDNDTLNKLRKFYNDFNETAGFEIYRNKNINHVNTAMSKNIEYKKNVYNFLYKLIQPKIDQVFKNYKIVIGNYIIKYPGGENECKVHQDIALMEETSSASSYTIWFALDDIDEKSGPLYIIPGTHKIFKNFVRGVGVTLGLNTFKEALLKKAKFVCPLKAGDVLVMNPRVIHGSYSTPESHKTRISIGLGIIPKNKDFVIYVREDDNVKKYKVNTDAILNYNPEVKYKFEGEYSIVSNKTIKKYDKYLSILKNDF